MVDRIDLLIAVVGIVVSILGSSTALWMALSKKADREDVARLETRLEQRFDRLESRFESRFERIEAKLDALILRLVPEQLPRPEN